MLGFMEGGEPDEQDQRAVIIIFFFCSYVIKTLLNATGLQEPEEQDVNTLLGERPQPC